MSIWRSLFNNGSTEAVAEIWETYKYRILDEWGDVIDWGYVDATSSSHAQRRVENEINYSYHRIEAYKS